MTKLIAFCSSPFCRLQTVQLNNHFGMSTKSFPFFDLLSDLIIITVSSADFCYAGCKTVWVQSLLRNFRNCEDISASSMSSAAAPLRVQLCDPLKFRFLSLLWIRQFRYHGGHGHTGSWASLESRSGLWGSAARGLCEISHSRYSAQKPPRSSFCTL